MRLEKNAFGAQFESAWDFPKFKISVGESPVLAQRSVGALCICPCDEERVHLPGTFHVFLQSLQRHKQRHRRDLAGLQTEASKLGFARYRSRRTRKAVDVSARPESGASRER